MSTLTPTAEPAQAAGAGVSPSTVPANLPSAPTGGLPDVSALAHMANAFFSALPGAVPALPVQPSVSVLSALPTTPALPSAPTPSLSPTTASQRPLAAGPHAAAPNGAPDAATTTAPAALPRAGGQALGVPQGYAPSLPQTDAAAPTSTQAFYFLGGGGYPVSAAPSLPDDRVSAQAFGLPGAEALRELLRSERAAPASASSGSGYYFLDEPRPAALGQAAGAPAAPSTLANGGVPARAGVTSAHAEVAPPQAGFDLNAVRRDFPILQERVNGKQIVWFDNAATTQKPQAVIDRLAYFYQHENSNIHRAAHELAARATDAYEGARETVRRFIGAASVEEIIFVRGATEGINLIAKTWGAQNIGAGDEIIVSHLEHHANIVPWQQLAAAKGAKLRVIPVDDDGQIILPEFQRLLSARTKLVSITQVSNALGTVVPVKAVIDLAHAAGVPVVVDGAQSISHMRVNVQALGADFFVFSGHKVFGPTGIGAVYGRRDLLEKMPPWQGGGNMIADVTFERTVYHGPPTRFEAGTGNIADAVGLGAALEYVERIGIDAIDAYEHALLAYATAHLKPIPGVRLVGTAHHKASVLSFVLAGYSTEEVGKALNAEGIAVRTGHHCAQPILRRFGLEATVRPSLAFYNTCEEVDRFIAVIRRLAGARKG